MDTFGLEGIHLSSPPNGKLGKSCLPQRGAGVKGDRLVLWWIDTNRFANSFVPAKLGVK